MARQLPYPTAVAAVVPCPRQLYKGYVSLSLLVLCKLTNKLPVSELHPSTTTLHNIVINICTLLVQLLFELLLQVTLNYARDKENTKTFPITYSKIPKKTTTSNKRLYEKKSPNRWTRVNSQVNICVCKLELFTKKLLMASPEFPSNIYQQKNERPAGDRTWNVWKLPSHERENNSLTSA